MHHRDTDICGPYLSFVELESLRFLISVTENPTDINYHTTLRCQFSCRDIKRLEI